MVTFLHEPLEPRRLLAINTIQVAIEPRIVQVKAEFLQDVGLSIKLNDITGTLTLTGDDLAQQTRGNRIEISGNVNVINNLAISDTARRSAIAFHTRGSDRIEIQNFASDGFMRRIDLSETNLTGSMNVAAAPRIVLGAGQGATINIFEAPGVPFVRCTAGAFSDSHFTASGILTLTSFNVDQWNGSTSTIDAGIIRSLRANVLDGNITLSVTPQASPLLKVANIDTIGPGVWNIAGNAGSINADTTQTGWLAQFNNLEHLKIRNNASGSVTANAMRDIRVGGDIQDMTVNLTSPFAPGALAINTVTINGNMINSNLFSQNSIRSITADGLQNSDIFIGATPGALPDQAADFTNTAIVGRIKIGGDLQSTGFTGSMLAAPFIQNLLLFPLLVSDTPEIATRQIDHLRGITTLGELFRANNVTTETDLIPLIRPTIIIVE